MCLDSGEKTSVAQLEAHNMNVGQSQQYSNTGQEERIHLHVLYSPKTLMPVHILMNAHRQEEKIYKTV